MSINRVQWISGNMNYASATSSTIGLSMTPVPGNCLFMYLGCVVALSINSVTQSGTGANWISVASTSIANQNVYIYALPNLPVGSGLEIDLILNSAAKQYYAIIEEISGLTLGNNILDQISYNIGAGNVFSVGLTPTTTSANEYWVNIYNFEGSLSGGFSTGGSPTNGYIIADSNPIGQPASVGEQPASAGGQFSGAGTTSWTGSGIAGLVANYAGLIAEYQIVSSKGQAGGSITDIQSRNNNFNAIALTFFGISTSGVSRRRTSSAWMN